MLIARQFLLQRLVKFSNRWMPAPSNNPVRLCTSSEAINPPDDRARFDWRSARWRSQRRNQRPLPTIVPGQRDNRRARQNGVKRDSSSGNPNWSQD